MYKYIHALVFFISLFVVDAEVIVEVEDQGVRWQIVSEKSDQDGALFILKHEGEDVMNMGGDSVPFPLARYNLPEPVIQKLAEAYVQYEIKSVGGIEALKAQVAQIDEIPSDLYEAYSKLFEVSAQPYYGTSNTGPEAMVEALKRFATTQKDLREAVEKYLRPLAPELIVYLGEQPEDEIGSALLIAIKHNPTEKILQQAVAVYAARQEGKFREQLKKSDAETLVEVSKAIKNASDSGLIGGAVKIAALRIAGSLN